MSIQPIVLLLNKNSAKNNRSLRTWLKQNGFLTTEAADAGRAMEKVSDFTVRLAPEVVLIEAVSPQKDFCLLRQMIQASGEISIFALSENVINHKECFEGNLAQVTEKFSLMHSKSARAARL